MNFVIVCHLWIWVFLRWVTPLQEAITPPLQRDVGTEFTDTVALGSGLTIKAQSIGVASRSQGFDGVDGILG